MWIIYFFVFYFIGAFLSSFTIIQILIILFFGMPITRKLERLGLLDENNKIIKRYFLTILILSLFWGMIAYVLYYFFPNYFAGFLVGLGTVLLFGLGKTGRNPNNISDYLLTNKRHFKVLDEEILDAINKI